MPAKGILGRVAERGGVLSITIAAGAILNSCVIATDKDAKLGAADKLAAESVLDNNLQVAPNLHNPDLFKHLI